MTKKLSVIGNSMGIVIEKPILELLKIDKNTELNISTDGERLIIEPIHLRKNKLLESAEKIMHKHESTFRKLAK